MDDLSSSLHRSSPRRYVVVGLLAASTVLLVLGLFLPVITLKEMIFWKSTFSVLTGISGLFQEKHYVLGVVILFFSVCFPIVKLCLLFFTWFARMAERQRKAVIEWLERLGKWSMLDVFVVAITIIITKMSHFAHADARVGIYCFGASIILAMVATEYIGRLMKSMREEEAAEPLPINKRRLWVNNN